MRLAPSFRTVAVLLSVTVLVGTACGGGDNKASTPAGTTASGSATAPGAQVLQADAFGRVVPQCAALTGEAPKSTNFPPSADPARNIPKDQLGKVNVVILDADIYAGSQANFVIGLTNDKDELQAGAKVRLTFYDTTNQATPKPYCQGETVYSAPGEGPAVVHDHADGTAHTHGGANDGRVGYYLRVKLPHAGFWGVAAEVVLSDGTRATASVGVDVAAKSNKPAPGMAAFKSDNPTKKDVTKISEIDSGDPPNDMHDVKIKDAIAAGRPLVIVFATPAFCTSRFCGPVTDEVALLQNKYKDKVDFVHIEIWKDYSTRQVNPTAREWLSDAQGNITEPYVYLVDKNGIIYDRFGGPAAANLIEAEVQALAAGKTYQ